MRFFLIFIFISLSIGENKNNSFYDLQAISIDGDTISMNEYKNKKIMIVNVASKCGYTSQYFDLQNLYTMYDSNFVI